MGSPENPNTWVFEDYPLLADIPVPDDLPSLHPSNPLWSSQSIPCSTPLSGGFDDSYVDSSSFTASNSKKRARSGSCSVSVAVSGSGSKACREKIRRDKLNDKFIELGSILDPGRAPKADKAAILVDAVRLVSQLRDEAQKLKESNDSLQEKIDELKAEKNELRDEKQRLKTEKESLEVQVKSLSSQPAFLPHPPMPAAFPTPNQAVGGKMVPFLGYPGYPMWQFMQPTAVDTSQDHVLRPPVA